MVSFSKNLLLLITLSLAIAVLWLTFAISQTQLENKLIKQPEQIGISSQGDISDNSANVRFAHANYLAAQQQTSEAIALYSELIRGADPVLIEASRYNSGLLYLQQALDARNSGDNKFNTQFIPLLEVAIQSFREVLVRNPEHYDARLALEQALAEIPETTINTAGWKENRTSIFSHVSGVSKGGP